MRTPVILLPGAVLPAALAYGGLIEALGDDVDARPKELEVYRGADPPAGYELSLEVDGVVRVADDAGFERFHLVGYSAGGAVAVAAVASIPERLLSVALLEPAWAGSIDVSPEEAAADARSSDLIAEGGPDMLRRFMVAELAPGVEPPAPPPGDPPDWMATRPAGLAAISAAFERVSLDRSALAAFERPVLYVLGGLSNPDMYGRRGERLARLFPDYRLERFEERHHFDPPHRVEPERLAAMLRSHWDRTA